MEAGSSMINHVSTIEIGYQVFVEEGGEECGAVREVAPEERDEIVVYIENAGDFSVPTQAIRSVHDGKVILDAQHLDERLRDAIAHAHDSEEP
jgi:hypothetical protein